VDSVGDGISRYLSWISSWKQGKGIYGGLHVHSCWKVSSVLEKKYQGVTVSEYFGLIRGFLNLYSKTGYEYFLLDAKAMCDALCSLLGSDGCFEHSVYEFEPGRGGCIHNALADLALLSFAEALVDENKDPDPYLKTVEKNFEWFMSYWWKRGNAWLKNPSFPCWCGVTNQDLAVCWAMALYGELKDRKYWEEYGSRVAYWYLENYFLPEYRCFLRGDEPEFPEPAPYHGLISYELVELYKLTGDSLFLKRALDVIEYLYENSWIDKYGLRRIHHNIDLKTGRVSLKPSLVTQGSLICALEELEDLGVDRFKEFKEELVKTLLFYQSGRGYFRNSTDFNNFFDIVSRMCPGEFEALTTIWRGGSLQLESEYALSIDFSGKYVWFDSDCCWELRGDNRAVYGLKHMSNGIFSGSIFGNKVQVSMKNNFIVLELDLPKYSSVCLDHVLDQNVLLRVKLTSPLKLGIKLWDGRRLCLDLSKGVHEISSSSL